MADFKIMTRGMPSQPDEWFRSQSVPVSELPVLTEDDQQRARLRRMTDEQYARHLMLRAFTREREEQEAERLGEIITGILRGLGGDFQLKGLWKRGLEPGWRARIESYASSGSLERVFDVPFPTEDFSDDGSGKVVNASDLEEIRRHLVAELNLGQDQRVAS